MTHGSFKRSSFWIHLDVLIFLFKIRKIYFSISNFHVNICYTSDPLFLSFSPYASAALFPALNSQLLILKCHPAPRLPTFSHNLGTARRMAQCSSTALKSLSLYILTQAIRKKCPYCIITQVPSTKACKWVYACEVLVAESKERKKLILWIRLLVSSKAGSSNVLSVCLKS